MKKNIFLAFLCVASIALVTIANYYERPVWGWGWARLLLAAPIIYAGLNFRRSVSVYIALLIIVSQEPLLIIKYSKNTTVDATHLVAVFAISFLSIMFAHFLRKEKEYSHSLEYIHNLIRSTRGILDENNSLSILEDSFSTWCKSTDVRTFLFDEDGGLRPRGHRTADPLPPKHFFYAVAKSREFLVSFNPNHDDRLTHNGDKNESESISQLAVFPIEYGGGVRGVICVANSMVDSFSKGMVEFLSAVKQTVETTLGLAEKLRQRIDHEMQITKIRSTFSSYLPPAIVEEALKHPDRIEMGGEVREVTVMFSEIGNFRDLLKTQPTEKLLSMLNEFFSVAMDAIFESDGTVDKFIEDNIMAYWGAPLAVADAEKKAIECALKIQRSINELNKKWEKDGKPSFHANIGINTGNVLAGNIGSEKRMEYTVIGDTVNMAARIKALSKFENIPILVGETTCAKTRHLFEFEKSFKADIKGKQEDVTVTPVKIKG